MQPTGGIENWLPRYDVGERHEVTMAVEPETALARALAAPAAPNGFIRILYQLRGLDPHGSIEEFMAANGFTVLERTPTTWVVGLVAVRRRIPIAGPAEWRSAAVPGSVKIAADFRAESAPGGTRLITETRVAAHDRAALTRFRLYWLVVGPFSKLIRRKWLLAAANGRTARRADDR